MKETVVLANKTEDKTPASPHSMTAEEAKAGDLSTMVRDDCGEGDGVYWGMSERKRMPIRTRMITRGWYRR